MKNSDEDSMGSVNCLREIRLAAREDKLLIELAYPVSVEDKFCLNILCGPNGCGKSYLLHTLSEGLSEQESNIGSAEWIRSKDLDMRLSLGSSQRRPKVLYIGKIWRSKDHIGAVKLDMNLSDEKENTISFSFMYSQLSKHIKDYFLSEEEWMAAEKRKEYFKDLRKDERLWTCNTDDPLVCDLQQILGGRLFFRWSKGDHLFELVLLHSIETAIPYTEWSDGQKAILYILLLVNHAKPDILLVDEVENHLHPEYMTTVLEAIKRRVPQTIIATHHPHVIFTEHADRVIYIDLYPCLLASLPRNSFLASTDTLRERDVRILENSFAKLSHIYKLFDYQDSQLLHQARIIAGEADLMLYTELMRAFQPEVVEPSPKPLPDRQSSQIADWVRGIRERVDRELDEVLLLDIGAGIGRIPVELGKISNWNLGSSVKWLCWEPDSRRRDDLRSRLSECSINAMVINSLEEVADGSVALSVIANVLHEVSPNLLVQNICNADQKINPQYGEIAVLEIYPLLRAERYAIPYPETLLKSLLNAGRLNCRSNSFPVRDVTAYCIFAKRRNPNETVDRYGLTKALEKLLDELLEQTLSSYASVQSMSGYEDFTRTLQDLTTIASISAYKNGFWT